MKKRSNRIILGMFIVMLGSWCLLIVNIFSASVLGKHLRSQEDITKYTDSSKSTSTIKARRGNIFDSTQTIIAEDVASYNLIAYLDKSRVGINNKAHYVVDLDETANFLVSVLGGETDFYKDLMTVEEGQEKYQTEFGTRGKGLDLKTKNLIEASGLPGLEFTQTSKRHYPLGTFSSQLVGFSDLDQEVDRQVGKMGIELYYDDYLEGSDGSQVNTVTINGYKLPNTTSSIIEAKDGDDIYLTLNKNVQLQLEDSLQESMLIKATDKAWGMVMEIATGKIIAIGQNPTFDPEIREDVEYLFYPTQFVYEPGSTMKAVTYATAIETGLDTNNTFDSSAIYIAYDENGKPYRVSAQDAYSNRVTNAGYIDFGRINFAQGFAASSNVAIVEILMNYLSAPTFSDYLDRFLFFKDTPLDKIPGASGQKLYNYPMERLTTGFGQGSSVTMLQLAQAYGAIINDGKMMKPYVVDQIVSSDKDVLYKSEPKVIANPISADTSAQMRNLMHGVVYDELATGHNFKVDEMEIIAKTGTAQLVVDGSYSSSRYIFSVGAAFPADNPKYLAFYAVESNFTEIAQNILLYTKPTRDLMLKTAYEYNLIQSDQVLDGEEDIPIKVSAMPSLINHSLDYAKEKLKDSYVDITVIGEGTNITRQYPAYNEKIITNQKIMLYTGSGKITMPDMTGWSRKEVTAFWSASGASFIIEGYGSVYNQDVPKGTIIDPKTEIRVFLK